MSAPPRLAFGEFVVDRAARRLLRGGAAVPLRPKSFATLELLIDRAGELVTKEDLLGSVWPGTAVSDTVLKVCIRELREALDDDPRQPRFIETRHRLGYRFVAAAAPADDRDLPSGEASTFVGRCAEMEHLGAALARAAAAAAGPRLVLVTGEAGLGKTTLVEELLRRARRGPLPVAACIGRCFEAGGDTEPFFPLLEAIGALAASEPTVRHALRTCAPSWCRELPAVFAGEAGAADAALGATRGRMLRELGDALREISSRRPLLLAIEDLHWADPSSLDLIAHLASSCARGRLLIAATLRPSAACEAGQLARWMAELAARGRAEVLSLQPLGDQEVDAYLERTLGRDAIDPELGRRLARRSEGHPLFLASLVQHLVDTGAIARGDDGRYRATTSQEIVVSAVPPDVGAMVARRLDDLEPELRELARLAAVQGDELRSDVLAAMAGEAPSVVEERLDRLHRARRLLVPSGDPQGERGGPAIVLRYRFVHALFRDALDASLAPSHRAELHRRLAIELEALVSRGGGPSPATIARHFELGRAAARAVQHYLAAAERAESHLALVEAEVACERAFGLVDQLPEHERDEAATRLHQRRAGLRLASGRFAEASLDLDSMRASAARAGRPELAVAALLLSLRQAGYLGRFDEAERLGQEALAVAESADDERAAAEVRGSLASLRGVQGDLDPARQGIGDALAAMPARGPDAARTGLLLDLASYHAMAGAYQAATDRLDELLPAARKLGDALRVGAGILWRAHTLANAGRLADAEEELDRAIRLTERNEDVFVLPRVLTCRAWVLREIGAYAEASSWNARALAVGGPAAMPDARAHALVGLALDELGRGEAAEASARLDEAAAIVEGPCFSDWLVRTRIAGGRARVALARGDLEVAASSARDHAARAVRHGLRKQLARALAILAEVAGRRGERAEELDAEARLAELLAEAPMPLVAWRALAAEARRRRVAGDDVGAASRADRAAGIVTRLAAGLPVHLRSALAALAAAEGLESGATAVVRPDARAP